MVRVAVTCVSMFVMLVVVLCSVAACSNEGIIQCSSGVAFCEDEYNTVIHLTEAHVWSDGLATYVINPGHMEDPQVQALIEVAHEECARLEKENR